MISCRKRVVSSSERTRKGTGMRSPWCRMIGTLPAWKWRSEAPRSATRRRKESKRAISAPGGLGCRPRRHRWTRDGPCAGRAGLRLRRPRFRCGFVVEERLELLLARRLHVRVLGADLPFLQETHQVLIHELHALLAGRRDDGRDLERLALADEVRDG